MRLHKSSALITMALLGPRIACRLSSKLPGHVHFDLPGPLAKLDHLQHIGVKLVYGGLYALVAGLSLTGLAQGAQIPFFGLFTLRLPGFVTTTRETRKKAKSSHSWLGVLLELALVAHVGATIVHQLQGH